MLMHKNSFNHLLYVTFQMPGSPIAFKISPHVTRLQRGLVLRANLLLITVYGDVMARLARAVCLTVV